MSRTLRLALVIVLAASTLLCAGATTSVTAAESARDPVVKAFVEYGDPAVSVPPGHRAKLSFVGRRGDIVHLSGAIGAETLRSAGRKVSETWPGYYRLRADRRYTLSVRTSETDPDYTQLLLLEKLVVRPLERDGRAVTFGSKRRGFVAAVSFDLKPRERTMITTPAYGSRVFTAHGEQLVYGDPILEVGQRLATARGDWYHLGLPLRAGEVIVLVGRKGTVRAIGSEIVRVPLDGALAAVKASRSPREVALRFSAASGQLVHLSGVPTTTRVSPTMYGPSHVTTRAAAGSVWRVTDAGIQTLGLFPEPGTQLDVGAAVVTRIGSMTADGPAFTFSPPEPGRWVYADVDGGYIPTLTATGSTFAPGVPWSASVTEPTSHNCLMPHGPNGCGEQGGATVTETTPQASSYFPLPPSTGSFVFLRVPPGVSGSVDLQVTKWVPPYLMAH
jgi:hypothetical protein